MLRRLTLRDFVIVSELDLDLPAGFTALTGETGAGKSILIDALQLVLGGRGDAGVVREGANRTDISAEFDTPPALLPWLEEAGFQADEGTDAPLRLRRNIDAQGKSRAWVNGYTATVGQLREAADHLVDIHGQHAWQSLTRPAAVRDLLDTYADASQAATDVARAFQAWRAAQDALRLAQSASAQRLQERERLQWQVEELGKLAPLAGEWDELQSEHRRLANAQSLLDAAREALDGISEADTSADSLCGRAADRLAHAAQDDPALANLAEELASAQALMQDVARSLTSYLHHAEPDPHRLAALDERLSAWLGLSRRFRRPPEALPDLLTQWQTELAELDAAADLDALTAAQNAALKAYQAAAKSLSSQRRQAAPKLSKAITAAMQTLGMTGGRFEVALQAQEEPQSFGLESVEFLVAGHAGSTPRPLAKVASGGELSRIALAIAVTTCQKQAASQATGTLIFDEIDAGVGGAVAMAVGQLMRQLGLDRQVLAVTHLPQVAACADHHHVVSKTAKGGQTFSQITPVTGAAREAEIARMLGGGEHSSTSLAHAQEMLGKRGTKQAKSTT